VDDGRHDRPTIDRLGLEQQLAALPVRREEPIADTDAKSVGEMPAPRAFDRDATVLHARALEEDAIHL
jgi:hypothetical protein